MNNLRMTEEAKKKKKVLVRGKSWCWMYFLEEPEAEAFYKACQHRKYVTNPPIRSQTHAYKGWWGVFFKPRGELNA